MAGIERSKSQDTATNRNPALPVRWEIIAAFAVTMTLTAFHIVAWASAGGLWRDEVHSVNMAGYPDVWRTWYVDSFPPLFHFLLRGWIAIFGGSDAAVRACGLTCGLGQIAAVWWAGRQFGARAPWALLVLLGFDPNLLVYGGEVRAYGLGVLTYLLMLGCMWRFLKLHSAANWLLLLVASLASVQANYPNSFLLLAACCGGGFVTLRRKNYGALLALFAIGVLSAASIVSYVALIVYPRTSQWAEVVQNLATFSDQFQAFQAALGAGGAIRFVAWPALLGLAIWAGCQAAFRQAADEPSADRADLGWFLIGNLVVGTAGFWWYMRFLGVITQVWYYLPLLALFAVSVEWGLHVWASSPKRQAAAAFAMIGVLVGMLPAALESIALRMTNVDLVATKLANTVADDDLVVVFPWYVGLPFDRYYHGAAAWINFPNVGNQEPRGHGGYAEMKRSYMTQPTPECIRKELDQIAQVLRSGHRVWLVGDLQPAPPGQLPPELPPGPDPKFGWSEDFYQWAWSLHASHLLQTRAVRAARVPVPVESRINPLENASLLAFEGWRDEPRKPPRETVSKQTTRHSRVGP